MITKHTESVEINEYQTLVLRNKNVFLEIGSPGTGTYIKIDISDLWSQACDYFRSDQYLEGLDLHHQAKDER